MQHLCLILPSPHRLPRDKVWEVLVDVLKKINLNATAWEFLKSSQELLTEVAVLKTFVHPGPIFKAHRLAEVLEA